MSGEPRFSVVDPAGPQAAHIDGLWDLFLGVAIAVTVLVVGFEIVAIARALRRRRREGESDPLHIDRAQERRIVRVVGAAVAATVVTLVGLLVASIRTGDALADLPADEPAAIVITGYQWWWRIEYRDPEPSRTVVTANELHVPVGRAVALTLVSGDVIHSFWVPSLGGKKDLVPGRENMMTIRADEAGTFRGQCAEFCGLQHARMGLRVIAQPPAEYQAWLAGQRSPAHQPSSARQSSGRELFLSGPCAMCHTLSGTEAGGALGPDLSHLMSRTTIAAGTLPNTRDNLRRWIRDPQAIKPGVRMPPHDLAPETLEELLDFLETLR